MQKKKKETDSRLLEVREADSGRPLSLTKPISEDISERKEVISNEELRPFPPLFRAVT